MHLNRMRVNLIDGSVELIKVEPRFVLEQQSLCDIYNRLMVKAIHLHPPQAARRFSMYPTRNVKFVKGYTV